jgi:hypothetical protein
MLDAVDPGRVLSRSLSASGRSTRFGRGQSFLIGEINDAHLVFLETKSVRVHAKAIRMMEADLAKISVADAVKIFSRCDL